MLEIRVSNKLEVTFQCYYVQTLPAARLALLNSKFEYVMKTEIVPIPKLIESSPMTTLVMSVRPSVVISNLKLCE